MAVVASLGLEGGATSAAPHAQHRQSTARFCSPHCAQVFREIWVIDNALEAKTIRSNGQRRVSL
jgi:hypothetical protein